MKLSEQVFAGEFHFRDFGEGRVFEHFRRTCALVQEIMKLEKMCEDLRRENAALKYTLAPDDAVFGPGHPVFEICAERDLAMRKYNELIMAVVCKFPNESRHDTALRYITERESQEVAPSAKSPL